MKRLYNIATRVNASVRDEGTYSGGTYAGTKTNTRAIFPIKRTVPGVKLVHENAYLGWATSGTYSTNLSIQSGLRGYTGSTPNGSGWTQQSSFSLAMGLASISSLLTLGLSSGDNLQVMTYAEATTAGKNVTATRFIDTTEGGEAGSGLTAATNGETLTAGLGSPSTKYGFTPAAILGVTEVSGIAFLGHSLVDGVGADPNQGWAHVAGETAGLPSFVVGRGGATMGTLGAAANNWEMAAIGADKVFLMCAINSINEWATNGSTSGVAAANYPTDTTLGTAARDQLRSIVRYLKGRGVQHVFYCTEGPCGTGATTKQTDTRNAWNSYMAGATGIAYTGVTATLATGAVIDGLGLTDIHWSAAGHVAVGEFVASEIATTLASYFTSTSDGYEETFLDPFWGAATAVGTAPSGWVAAHTSGTTKLYQDGDGNLAISSGTVSPQYAICQTEITTNSIVEAYSAAWSSSTTAGLLVGLHPSATYTSDTGGSNRGYDILVFYNEFRIYRLNSGQAFIKQVFFSSNLAAGDIVTVKVYRSLTGANNILDVRVFKNGVQCHTTSSHTDTSTPVGWNSTLYPSLGTRGDGATAQPDGPVWDMIRLANYNPITIGTVTVAATLEVEIGGTRPVVVTVLDDTGAPAGAQTVTASYSGDTGVTVTGSVTTDGEGNATFYIAAGTGMVAGDTGTVTFTCSAVTDTCAVSIVDIGGLTAGASGGAEMTINETVTKAVTTSWSEVVDGASASIGGKSYKFGFAAKNQVVEFRVAASTPSDGDIGDRLAGDDPRQSDTVATGKKLYVRSKDGNTFNIPVHLSA